MTDMDGPILSELRRQYLSELGERLEELRADAGSFRAGDPDAVGLLRAGFHRLAGSGGSYGFPEISDVAREMEQWLADTPSPAQADRVDTALGRLSELLHRARAAEGGQKPEAGGDPQRVWRARLILPNGPEREQLAAALREAAYEVQLGSRQDDPGALPAPYRPDLIVIGLGVGEGDPSAVASRWTGARSGRPRAVVLVELLRAVDRLRAGAAGVDAVLPLDRLVEELPRYARVLMRVGAPPSTVLLVEADAERSRPIAERLGESNVRVVRTPRAAAVQELLDREVPDLLLLGTRLVDGDGYSVARMVRNDPRFAHLPIVCLGSADVAERIEALQAGADDFLVQPADPELLLHTVISRAERGRRLREALYRDPLTGLLNHHTLMTELEHAVGFCRRQGEPLAFVVFDLDRFGEVNERFGQMVGDQVLLHVANVFRSNVRASDVIGRYGGEEFAMILRGGSDAGAAVLAAKLRRVLGEQAAATAEGVIIPLNVSVGWAAYPQDGTTAGELAHAAVRALRREKTEKA